jgi:hypothetical protein
MKEFIKVTLLTILALLPAATVANVENKCFNEHISLNANNLSLSDNAKFNLVTKIEDDLDVTSVSKQEAQEIFNYLSNKKYIPFDYNEVGCEARAHQMAKILDGMCIQSAKAFLIGDISFKGIRWQHHVAPVILVNEEDTITPYIIDPSVSKELITLSEWSELLKRGKILGRYSLKVSNQYAYMPEDFDEDRSDYTFGDNIKTKLGLGLFKVYETASELPEDTVNLLKKVIK